MGKVGNGKKGLSSGGGGGNGCRGAGDSPCFGEAKVSRVGTGPPGE